jgi:chorismate mutase/prephenate dehydratase
MNVLDSLTELNIEALSKDEKRDLLTQIRDEIDSIDDSLAELLNYRAAKYEILSTLKQQLDLNNYSPQREKEIIERIGNSNKSNLSSKDLTQVFERIIDVSRAIQKKVRNKN